ncbi:hypothetical protein HOY33_12255 [Brenneria sp. hezel4-2-4]|nr:hypothetical protein [Brenneria sp. hezel4-2-4]
MTSADYSAVRKKLTLPNSLIDRIDRCVATNPEFKRRSGFLAQAALERISAIR